MLNNFLNPLPLPLSDGKPEVNRLYSGGVLNRWQATESHYPLLMPTGRFAPSPTGPMHLGNLRTALLAWLQARSVGGRFILRFEDLDTGRVRGAAYQTTRDDLHWLGLDWDAEYRQSERLDLYAAALAQLDTYPCTVPAAKFRPVSRPRRARPTALNWSIRVPAVPQATGIQIARPRGAGACRTRRCA